MNTLNYQKLSLKVSEREMKRLKRLERIEERKVDIFLVVFKGINFVSIEQRVVHKRDENAISKLDPN